MTDEQARKRNEFANALFAVSELAKSVPSDALDYSIPYIIERCRKWAEGYLVNGWGPDIPAPSQKTTKNAATGSATSSPNPTATQFPMSDTKDKEQKKLKRLSVTCWSNDPDIGNERRLVVFEDGNSCLDQQTAQSKAMYWLEDLLDATNNFSLFDALRKIQNESNFNKNPPPFPNMVDMPLIIVNLLLKEYGLEIEED